MFEKIEEAWTEDSGIYDDLIQKQLSDQKDVLHWMNTLRHYIGSSEGKQVLDVGTGPGLFSILLSRMGYRVTAVDGAQGMVEHAEKNFKAQKVDVELFCDDVVKLEKIQERTFDAVVSRDVVWTLYDPEAAYRRWMEILKPGGKLIVFDGNYRTDRNSLRIRLWRKIGSSLTRLKEGKLKHGKAKVHMDSENVFQNLPFAAKERPECDREILTRLGYQILEIGSDQYRNSMCRWEFWTGGYQGKKFKIVARKPMEKA